MAAVARDLLDAGAHLVGGCCGTGPDDVRAIAIEAAARRCERLGHGRRATPLARTVTITGPIDLRRTLLPLQRGTGDPTMRVGEREVWRATRTTDGPATLHLSLEGRTAARGSVGSRRRPRARRRARMGRPARR